MDFRLNAQHVDHMLSFESVDVLQILSNSRLKNPKNVIFSYLNINSIRNKFENLQEVIKENVDILAIAETKIDSSFPKSQFLLNGFHNPYRLDVTKNSGGILVYVKSRLPSRRLTQYLLPNDIQAIAIELNLRKEKWLVVSIYKPPSQNNKYFLEELTKMIDYYSNIYEKQVIMGDFNIESNNKVLTDFMDEHLYINLIKDKTCFKGQRGTCIDLLLTNQRNCFKKSSSYETGISDHHHLIYTMLKATFQKLEPNKVSYRNYKTFDYQVFANELNYELQYCSDIYAEFESTFIKVLDSHAPKKFIIVRGNHKPHIDKELRRAIMKRSQLKNKANKTKAYEDIIKYKKQRNYVVRLNKETKCKFFETLDTTMNAKSFWNCCKPYFSNKSLKTNNSIMLVEKQ